MMKLSVSVCLLLLIISVAVSKLEYPYEIISFDYSAHKLPLSYRSYGNTVELANKVKLNPPVPNRGGAYRLAYPLQNQKDFEVEVEFSINSELKTSRGFEMIFNEKQFDSIGLEAPENVLGFKT